MFGKILVFPWFKWLAIIFNILEEAFFACLFAFGSHMLQLDATLVQNSFMFLACVWFFYKIFRDCDFDSKFTVFFAVFATVILP